MDVTVHSLLWGGGGEEGEEKGEDEGKVLARL